MLRVLVDGTLAGDPASRTTNRGVLCTTAQLRYVDGRGNTVPCDVVAYNAAAEQLARLRRGDSVAVTGSAVLGWHETEDRLMCRLRVKASRFLDLHAADLSDAAGLGDGPSAEVDELRAP